MENNTEGRRDGMWAQPYSLASGQTQFHQLGHVRLWVTLLDLEWQIRTETLELDTDPVGWTEATSWCASCCCRTTRTSAPSCAC